MTYRLFAASIRPSSQPPPAANCHISTANQSSPSLITPRHPSTVSRASAISPSNQTCTCSDGIQQEAKQLNSDNSHPRSSIQARNWTLGGSVAEHRVDPTCRQFLELYHRMLANKLSRTWTLDNRIWWLSVYSAPGSRRRSQRILNVHPRTACSHGDCVHVARSSICRLSNGQRATSI